MAMTCLFSTRSLTSDLAVAASFLSSSTMNFTGWPFSPPLLFTHFAQAAYRPGTVLFRSPAMPLYVPTEPITTSDFVSAGPELAGGAVESADFLLDEHADESSA